MTRSFVKLELKVGRDYKGLKGTKAKTAKQAWQPANHPKFDSVTEMKNVNYNE